ncbi:hypothetical protein LC607_26820 [Nostoc sp. CHAB 5824]|nr:hypothetical protein [Nostoc sp. CHAB 5824]
MNKPIGFIIKSARLYEIHCKGAIAPTVEFIQRAIALTPEFTRRSDRLYEDHCKKAMSTTGYANATTDDLSRKGDRLCEGHSEKRSLA